MHVIAADLAARQGMMEIADFCGLLQRVDGDAAGGIEAGRDLALVVVVGADSGDERTRSTRSRVRKAVRADEQVTTMSQSRAAPRLLAAFTSSPRETDISCA